MPLLSSRMQVAAEAAAAAVAAAFQIVVKNENVCVKITEHVKDSLHYGMPHESGVTQTIYMKDFKIEISRHQWLSYSPI